jgi:hypothetical protein
MKKENIHAAVRSSLSMMSDKLTQFLSFDLVGVLVIRKPPFGYAMMTLVCGAAGIETVQMLVNKDFYSQFMLRHDKWDQ